MNISIPVEVLPGMLALFIAFGQLIGRRHKRKVFFAIVLLELAYLHVIRTGFYLKDSITDYMLITTPVFMSLGIFIYFYILILAKGGSFNLKKGCIQFIPPVLSLVVSTVLYVLHNYSVLVNESSVHFSAKVLFAISIWWSLWYVALSVKFIFNYIRAGRKIHPGFKFMFFLLIFVSFAELAGVYTVINRTPGFSPLNIFYVSAVSISMVALFFLMQMYPYYLQYGMLSNSKREACKTTLEGIDVASLEVNLMSVMKEEKLFCDEDLSLSRLSDVLNINSRHLSRFINEKYNKNYNTFINNFRIEESKKMLLTDPERNILDIANSVGFNSYSVFYTAFKDNTSMSPVEYRKKNV